MDNTVGAVQWYTRMTGGPEGIQGPRGPSSPLGQGGVSGFGSGNNTKRVHISYKYKVYKIQSVQ